MFMSIPNITFIPSYPMVACKRKRKISLQQIHLKFNFERRDIPWGEIYFTIRDKLENSLVVGKTS